MGEHHPKPLIIYSYFIGKKDAEEEKEENVLSRYYDVIRSDSFFAGLNDNVVRDNNGSIKWQS